MTNNIPAVLTMIRYIYDNISYAAVSYTHLDVYKRQREERLKADTIAYEKQQEYIKKTEEYIDKYRAGIKLSLIHI